MESWASSLVFCTLLTAFTSISPNSAGMKREPRTIPPARSRYPRERAAGDHVHAGRPAGALLYRDARRAEYDRWQSDHAHANAAGSWICLDHQILSQQPAADHLLADDNRQESLHQLHQPAGENHPANQA